MECETMEEEYSLILEALRYGALGSQFSRDLIKDVCPDDNIRVIFHTKNLNYSGLYMLPKNNLKILFI